MAGKETLSMKQASNIIDSTNEIMSNLVRKIEQKNEEFIRNLSTIWEDQNAMDYMRQHKSNMESFISELSQNTNIFGNALKDIADAYAAAGGIATRLAVSPVNLIANFDISAILDHFSDSEDEFGFRNPESGAEQVMDALNDLSRQITEYVNDAISRIRGINAFGNQQVQLNLAESAGRIVSIMNEHLNSAINGITNFVGATAQNYMNVGSSAETASRLSSN